MNLEEQLINQYGRERHFSVPDGYFAEFNHRIIGMLDEGSSVAAREVSMWQRVRYKLSVAAMIAVMLGVGVYSHFATAGGNAGSAVASSRSQVSASASALDQAADYIMIDESDMYAYLADN